ncbi:MAG: DUF2157 domain-containing protein [Nocardioides sp.]
MDTDLATRPATRAELDWLTSQLHDWRTAGLVDDGQATAIRGRYHVAPDPARRFSLARLLLGLGAGFVGVGLIWLVAANLDQLPPLLRFVAVAAIWLALLVAGEALHARGSRVPSPVVGSIRLLAALAFGAVIFQAAQSLQVPAYEPGLVGLWGVGALVHAYGVRALGPLLVGIPALVVWFVWQVMYAADSPFAVVLVLAVVAVVGFSVAALHERWLARFAPPWREVGAAAALAMLFAAALPYVTLEDFAWSRWLVAGLVVAGIAAVAATLLARGRERFEPLGAVAVAAVSVGLVLWDTGTDTSELDVADWAHAGLSVAVYVVVAVGVAVLGIVRDSWRLTALAMIGLVAFTTFQSFAVFAQIIQGAWLFLVLGLIFLGTGYGFDRARRELAATLEGEDR